MTRTRIKICCIASSEEADLALSLGADALGLVGNMPSGPGIISDDEIREITDHLPDSVDSFLLTSRTCGNDIADHVEYCNPRTVQIVRHIDVSEYPKIIKRLPHTRRVQVIHVEDASALRLIKLYEPYVDAFLLDSGRPNDSLETLGGTGNTHDWKISARCVAETQLPVYLAGGLNSANVSSAIRTVAPFGVDLCSGVRTNDVLDKHLLREYVDRVRATEQ